MTRIVVAIALLTAIYALALASLHPLDLAAGVLVAALVVVPLRRHIFDGPPASAAQVAARALAFPRFALAVLVEVVRGTWTVSLVVVGARPLRQPGIVAVPIGERSRTGVAATALAITLSPGEVLVDVDWDRGAMLLHVIDARDPDAVRRHHDRFYERYQRRVFP